jgi:hypothetical protein
MKDAKVIQYKGKRYILEAQEQTPPNTIMFEGKVFKLKGKLDKKVMQESTDKPAPKCIKVKCEKFYLKESK